MTNVTVYNRDGNATGDSQAPALLSTPWNASLVHQVFKALSANRRRPVAHTKDRSEVSGGGIKPWRQKGTGRARHGSSRSPIWRHGGITFGPRNDKDYSQKVNKKMAATALASALTKKFASDQLRIMDTLVLAEAKTNVLAKIITNITHGKSALLVVADNEKTLVRAGANIVQLDVTRVRDLSVYDVLTHTYIIMDTSVMKLLEKSYE